MAQSKVATGYVELKADIAGLKTDLNKAKGTIGKSVDESQKKINSINWGAVGAAAVIAATAGVYALARAISAVTEAANIQESAEARLEAVVRATGASAGLTTTQMKDYADQLQSVTTFGDEVTISAMAILATFKEVREDAFERTTAVAQDMATVMGQDLNSAMVMIAKAMNDPIANLSAMSRAGVQFTEDQKEMVRVLWEAGETMKAQNIILGELESQFGGAAIAAAQTFGGGLDQASNAMGDLKEEIGFAITKNELFINLTHLAKDAFIDWGREISSNRERLAQLVQSGLLMVIEAMRAFHNAWLGIKTVANTVIAFIATGINTLMTPFDMLFRAAAKIGVISGNPLEGMKLAIEDFDESSKQVLADTIQDISDVNAKYDGWKAKIEETGTSMIDMGESGKTAHEKIATTAIIATEKVAQLAVVVTGYADAAGLAAAESQLLQQDITGYSDAAGLAAAETESLGVQAETTFTSMETIVGDTTSEIGGLFTENVTDILSGDFEGIELGFMGMLTNMLRDFGNWIGDLASQWIASGIMDLLGISGGGFSLSDIGGSISSIAASGAGTTAATTAATGTVAGYADVAGLAAAEAGTGTTAASGFLAAAAPVAAAAAVIAVPLLLQSLLSGGRPFQENYQGWKDDALNNPGATQSWLNSFDPNAFDDRGPFHGEHVRYWLQSWVLRMMEKHDANWINEEFNRTNTGSLYDAQWAPANLEQWLDDRSEGWVQWDMAHGQGVEAKLGGDPYIASEGGYYLHQGESVVDAAAMNALRRYFGGTGGGGGQTNITVVLDETLLDGRIMHVADNVRVQAERRGLGTQRAY